LAGDEAVRTGVGSAVQRALRATRATVWPHPSYNFNANKSYLPLTLRRRRIPAAPAFDVALDLAESGAHADAQLAAQLTSRAAGLGWSAAFLKPHGGSFMDDVDRIELTGGAASHDKARLAAHIGTLRARGVPGLVVMQNLPAVAHHWEVRIFFAAGAYAWAVANRVDAVQFARPDVRKHDFCARRVRLERDAMLQRRTPLQHAMPRSNTPHRDAPPDHCRRASVCSRWNMTRCARLPRVVASRLPLGLF
jgi:hypothetical protein